MYLRHTERREEVSEGRGEGLRKRETRSSKLETRGEREVRARLLRFRMLPGVEERIGQPRRLLE